MNISSIAASTPVTPLTTSTSQTPAPDVQAANDAGAAQPPVQAALPPGQGTRIDQIA
jgi:hypothetical protein